MRSRSATGIVEPWLRTQKRQSPPSWVALISDRPAVAWPVLERVAEEVRDQRTDERLLACDDRQFADLKPHLAKVDFGCQQPQAVAHDQTDVDRAAPQRTLGGVAMVQQRLHQHARVRAAAPQRVEIVARLGVDVALQAAGHDRRVGLGRDQRLDQLVRSNRHESHTVGVLALELGHADSQAPVLRLERL